MDELFFLVDLDTAGGTQRLASTKLGKVPVVQLHGLGVEAASTELTFTVAAAGKVDFEPTFSFTGSIGFVILDSNTAAFIDNGATVMALNVNVTARNDARTFGAAVNLAYTSGIGVAGGFDVGLIRNDTTATVGGNLNVVGDVAVHAISREQVDSFVGAVGYTAAGLSLVASVSLYSIRADFAPIFGQDILGFLSATINADTLQGFVDDQLSALTSTVGGGLANLLNNYAQTVGGGHQGTATAISQALPHDPVESAVSATLVDENTGTQAHISGGTIVAGGNVEVTGREILHVVLDTSFSFNFGSSDAILPLENDRGILSTGGAAGAFIDSAASVTAHATSTWSGTSATTSASPGPPPSTSPTTKCRP